MTPDEFAAALERHPECVHPGAPRSISRHPHIPVWAAVEVFLSLRGGPDLAGPGWDDVEPIRASSIWLGYDTADAIIRRAMADP